MIRTGTMKKTKLIDMQRNKFLHYAFCILAASVVCQYVLCRL